MKSNSSSRRKVVAPKAPTPAAKAAAPKSAPKKSAPKATQKVATPQAPKAKAAPKAAAVVAKKAPATAAKPQVVKKAIDSPERKRLIDMRNAIMEELQKAGSQADKLKIRKRLTDVMEKLKALK